MEHKNRVTRFLRWVVHLWWYLALVVGVALACYIVGNETGMFGGINTMDIPVEWEVEDVEPVGDFFVAVSDASGTEFPVAGLEGKGLLKFRYDSMGGLSFITYFAVAGTFGIGLFGLHQLRRLFDDLVAGRYFEEINARRIRRLSYCLFGFYGLRFLTQVAFESLYSVRSGAKLEVQGVEIGLDPLLLAALALLTVSEVIREGAKLQAKTV